MARQREAVIRVLAQGTTTKSAVEAATITLGLGRSVVYDLVRRYRRRPQTSSLLPLRSGRETRSHFLGWIGKSYSRRRSASSI